VDAVNVLKNAQRQIFLCANIITSVQIQQIICKNEWDDWYLIFCITSDNSYCGFLECNTTQFAGTVAPDEHSLHQRDRMTRETASA
jgi:hypothetical protein